MYIFKDILKNKHSWTQTSIIVANDGIKGDEFGFSINILNNILVIGSPNRDSLGTDMVGAAYIFSESSSGQYTQLNVITNYFFGSQTRFGCSLASYENMILIGGCSLTPSGKFFSSLYCNYYLSFFY